jgi:hypothetical protein
MEGRMIEALFFVGIAWAMLAAFAYCLLADTDNDEEVNE